MKNQALSIEQIFKLQNLGFDVIKNSSSIVIIKENGPFIVNKEMIEKNIFGITDKIEDMFYSMTIGDIIEVLPMEIKIEEDWFYFRMSKISIEYFNMVLYKFPYKEIIDDNIINHLFNLLIWCIKQKHIKI